MNPREEREMKVRERLADAASTAAAAIVELCKVFTRLGLLLEEEAKKEAADRRDLQGNVGGKK